LNIRHRDVTNVNSISVKQVYKFCTLPAPAKMDTAPLIESVVSALRELQGDDSDVKMKTAAWLTDVIKSVRF